MGGLEGPFGGSNNQDQSRLSSIAQNIAVQHHRSIIFRLIGLTLVQTRSYCGERGRSMHPSQRYRLIESTLAERQFVTNLELTAILDASQATIRRDIAALADAGRLRRVRGGAEILRAPSPARSPMLQTPDFEATRRRNLQRKRAIARAAAALCAAGDSVIINGGTTTYCLGEFIAEKGMQVLTNSFALAAYLVANGNCRVVLPGGDVYCEQSLIVSPY